MTLLKSIIYFSYEKIETGLWYHENCLNIARKDLKKQQLKRIFIFISLGLLLIAIVTFKI